MRAIEIMQAEFESHQLQVALVPSKRHDARCWDMIRCAISRNCRWYRLFCARHTSDRRRKNSLVDTRIKRRNIERALQGLLDGTYNGKYASELLGIARRLK